MGSPKGIFITGTDTGVGKTVVTAALTLALRARGLRVGVMKPVESGCERVGAKLIPQDGLLLSRAAGLEGELDRVTPYRMEHPVAPALAAEIEGVEIDLDEVTRAYGELAKGRDLMLVEGAGGLLAPLSGDSTMVDVARALDLPIMIVARNALGTINHTSLTVRAAQVAGSRVLGIILNSVVPLADSSASTNAASLRRWAQAPFLGEVPYLTSLSFDVLAVAAERHIDLTALMQSLNNVAVASL